MALTMFGALYFPGATDSLYFLGGDIWLVFSR